MFTGIIQQIGQVKKIDDSKPVFKVYLDLGSLMSEISIGDSVACNGVCLTVAKVENGCAVFDVMSETLCKTNFEKLGVGSQVNIELAMKLSSRLGGHIVTGHVDFVSELLLVDANQYFFSLPSEYSRFLADKGSVTVNGTSLTVTKVENDRFAVDLIPTTLKDTNLGDLKLGDKVNIEVDVIARYVDRLTTVL